MKKYNPFENIRLWVIIAIIVMINIIVIGNFYLNTADNILAYRSNDGTMFIQSIPTYGNNQAVPIILGITFFELFRRIKIPSNRIINFIGSSTFMVYLLHDNEFVYKIWNTQDWITLLYENVIRFFYTYIVWILKTFAAGILGYCIFMAGGKLLNICKPLIMKQPKHVFKENS